MSQRVKRPNRSEDGSVPVKRRKRTAAEEEEAASLAAAQANQGSWQPRANDLKTIYNRTTTEAPAELFRKDLISAMKLPDSEPLAQDEYWVIVDQWKQEWERGVQVPVNPDSLPEPCVSTMRTRSYKVHKDFRLPKNQYIRITKDENFDPETHAFSNAPAQAEAACSYDLDECDVAWLKILNAERAACCLPHVYEDQLERVMERLELCCWEKIQSILRNEEGLGIEYDENVICDVCRSPDSEDGNEMVFCDSCNICVHQACYGITKIPEGQWLCCTCKIGKRPDCMLCPNKGGAMKSTRTGQKWAHVSCALWIPEVSIGCVEKMEPITKISSIPSSRWALICVLCRERRGACIQCSVKTCKTAYHVTCAFKHGLEMRAIIEDENADDGVKLRSYCEKHSKSSKKSEKSVCSGSEEDDSKRKKRKDMTNEEKNQARAARLQEIESEFFKHVAVKDVESLHVGVDSEALQYIYNYWKLKRKAGNNKPLLPPKSEDVDVLSQKREQADLEKMKMFVQVRQDLERVRNLCYMVSRREKLSRSFFRMREQTFHKQAAVLQSSNTLPSAVIQAVIEANHGPSIYDRLYSHNNAEDHTSDFDAILARIAGVKSPTNSGDELNKSDVNGLFRDVKNNPYKKVYFNGSSKRRNTSSLYGSSLSSAGSSDELPKDNKENQLRSSSDDDKHKKKVSTTPRKRPDRKKRVLSRSKAESSSEDDVPACKQPTRSRLGQVARQLGDTGSESDDLLPMKTSKKFDNHLKNMSSIYSDSESSDVSAKNPNDTQNTLRTKAAVKDFSNKGKSPKRKPKVEDKVVVKKKDYVPSDLIVPQRQAAKKASENLKLTNRTKEHQQVTAVVSEDLPVQAKPEEKERKEIIKPKPKGKSPREVEPEKKPSVPSNEDNQELLAFVPQRQAAKKAAEHIKSGLGGSKSALPAASATTETPQPTEPPPKKDQPKTQPAPAKIQQDKRKSSTHSSSTSSSSSSSSSDSTSSSDSEETPAPQPRSESRDESAKRSSNAKDWPFLDKGARSAASSSSTSDSSGSSDESTPSKPVANRKPAAAPNKKSPATGKPVASPKKPQKTVDAADARKVDKKLSATSPTKREEPARRGRGRPPRARVQSGDRIRDVDVRPGDLPNDQRVSVEREQPEAKRDDAAPTADIAHSDTKKTVGVGIQSPIGKTDEDVKPPEPDLEKEIRERKASKEKDGHKSTLEKLFGSPNKKTKDSSAEIKHNSITNNTECTQKISEDKTNETKLSEEISNADRIVDDHLQSQKLQDTLMESYQTTPDTKNASKSLEELEDKPMFSPPSQSKTTDLLDLVSFEESLGLTKEEMMKGPSYAYNNMSAIKEDSKEDSARETLNLVEKLRMGLNKKSSDDTGSVNDAESGDNLEQVVPENTVQAVVDDVFIKEDSFVKESIFSHEKEPVPAQQTPTPAPLHEKPFEEQSQGMIHSAPVEGDERWVPPSDTYASIHLNNQHQQQFMHQFPTVHPPQETPPIPVLNQPILDSRISQTPMSVMPSPSPRPHIHPSAIWADSSVMPSRRSSSSSSSSTTSEDKIPSDVQAASLDNMATYMPYPANHLDHFGGFPDPSMVPVSLFPPPNVNTQISFPPTGSTGMFPPAFGAPFPTSTIPTMTKPMEESIPYSATFTSTQHNMEFTAAMVNIPTTIEEQTVDLHPPTAPTVVETPLLTPTSKTSSDDVMPVIPAEIGGNVMASPSAAKVSVGKKSPSKPTRTSARVTSQLLNKSPAKSPGKSPRQMELSQKQSNQGRGRGEHKRGSGKSGVAKSQSSSRGRGRGKGRGRVSHHNDFDFMGSNTIHNKLVGTVYDLDFDDDICNENMADLKSMRERRKSVDVHEKKFDSYSSPKSPKFASPKNRFNADLKPPSPKVETEPVVAASAFPNPVLPGPVDMRTYNNTATFDQPSYNEQNLLSAFACGTAGAQVHEELDEDFEKALHTALSNSKKEEPATPEVANNNSSNIKVSLSDSRNQLKVKIKGPIANYAASVPLVPRPTMNTVSNVSPSIAANNMSANIPMSVPSVGTSNLRRMRKKELLRQYWTQDMNMDDPSSNPSLTTTPTVTPSVSRTIITIPKAVASMTSIPTKEDYRDYRTDDFTDTKHHKKSRGLARELKHLDVSINALSDRRRGSASSGASNVATADGTKHKIKGRAAKTTPKLKIKIGPTSNSVVTGDENKEESRMRPPKKRLAPIMKPSVEDLMRDSMKFRKQVMADLKIKHKKDKHKRRDRKKSNGAEVRIISDQTTSTKLIIRFGKPKVTEPRRDENCDSAGKNADGRTKDTPEPKPDKPKHTPIKLKISRCGEGSGYVTKPAKIESDSAKQEDRAAQPGQPPPDPVTKSERNSMADLPLQPPPAPPQLSKDCEVR